MQKCCRLIALVTLVAACWTSTADAQTGADRLQKSLDLLNSGKPDQALDEARAAAADIAESLPFAIHRAILVEEKASAYGMEQARDGNRYRPGEPILIYLEPRGYAFDRTSGLFNFGYSVDLLVLAPDGTVLGGQQNFGSWQFESRMPSLETFINLTIELEGVPGGDYIVELVLHDLTVNDVSARTRIDVSIDE